MISGIIAFLGSNVFRLIFGELVAGINKHIEHKQELERMDKQEQIDATAFTRQQEAIKNQHAMGVDLIHVQSEADITKLTTEAWGQAVKDVGRSTGVWFVDLWNGIIRPALATWSIVMITGDTAGWWKMSDNTWAIAGAALGIYLASRDLFKRGK